MPHRDDFEDFDKETENLVAQIADKSVEDEDLDVALKLAQCDIYERRLREQVGLSMFAIKSLSQSLPTFQWHRCYTTAEK